MLRRTLCVVSLAGAVAAGPAWASATAGPPAAGSPSLKQILARHEEAMGGLEAWRSVETKRVEKTEIYGDREVRVTDLCAYPDRLHSEAWSAAGERERSTLVVVNGDEARVWSEDTGGWAETRVRGRQIFQGLCGFPALVDWQARGLDLELLGLREVSGGSVWQIRERSGSGSFIWSLDPRTFLAVRRATADSAQVISFDSYETVAGLKTPMVTRHVANGKMHLETRITAVAFGVDLAGVDFAPWEPDVAVAAAPPRWGGLVPRELVGAWCGQGPFGVDELRIFGPREMRSITPLPSLPSSPKHSDRTALFSATDVSERFVALLQDGDSGSKTRLHRVRLLADGRTIEMRSTGWIDRSAARKVMAEAWPGPDPACGAPCAATRLSRCTENAWFRAHRGAHYYGGRHLSPAERERLAEQTLAAAAQMPSALASLPPAWKASTESFLAAVGEGDPFGRPEVVTAATTGGSAAVAESTVAPIEPAAGAEPGAAPASGDGWVNDTWRLRPNPPGWRGGWRGQVVEINLPKPFCEQGFPGYNPWDCSYPNITREHAQRMGCDQVPGGGRCDVPVFIAGNSYVQGSSYLVAYSGWLGAKLALAGVSGYNNERESRQGDPHQWCAPGQTPGYTTQCFGKVGAASGEWDTRKRIGFSPGQIGSWIGVAISPDTANRHRGGIQLSMGPTAEEAWDNAMGACKMFSTTGNCFVVDLRYNLPDFGVLKAQGPFVFAREFDGSATRSAPAPASRASYRPAPSPLPTALPKPQAPGGPSTEEILAEAERECTVNVQADGVVFFDCGSREMEQACEPYRSGGGGGLHCSGSRFRALEQRCTWDLEDYSRRGPFEERTGIRLDCR